MNAETKRVAIRRYELMQEQVEIMRGFCSTSTGDLYAIYRKEWARCLDKMYGLYYRAFQRYHPDLF